MANPVTPARVKALIPSLTGSMCERLSKLMQFPQLLYEEVLYKYKENGQPTDEYAAEICALGCVGTGGGDGGGDPGTADWSTPTRPIATDGAFSDHVNIQWPVYSPPVGSVVHHYKLFRSENTNTNPANAEAIATIDAPTVTYDDTTAVAGTIYHYWYRAYVQNESAFSPYSAYDPGSASVPTTTLTAVSDLRASYGFSPTAGGLISLVWTPPTGATKYDVYRGLTNVYADAVKVYSDIVPTATTVFSISGGAPQFWDNVGELVLTEIPPDDVTDYYYWVVAKKNSPAAISLESNDAVGRVLPPSIYNGGSSTLTYSSPSDTVPLLHTKAWIYLQGGGGGGAGGGSVYGGGGGGSSSIIVHGFTVAPGDTIELITSGPTPDTGNAARETSGVDGTINEIQINGVTVMICNAGEAGLYNPAGAGDGGNFGAGGSAAGVNTIYGPIIYTGAAGLPGSGSSGGRSGYHFGKRRQPHADAFGLTDGNGSSTGNPGAGSKAISLNADLAVGGKGTAGSAFVLYGS